MCRSLVYASLRGKHDCEWNHECTLLIASYRVTAAIHSLYDTHSLSISSRTRITSFSSICVVLRSSILNMSSHEDPFRDANVSAKSSIHRSSGDNSGRASYSHNPARVSQQSSHSSRRIEIRGDATPRRPQVAHVRDSVSPSSLRPQQARHLSTNTQGSIRDDIYPVPAISRDQSVDSVPFRKPWLEKNSSYNDSITSTLSTRRPAPEAIDRSPEVVKKGNIFITITKWIFIVFIVSTKCVLVNYTSHCRVC